MSSKVYDVVDVLSFLNSRFPDINFVTEDRIINRATHHVFFIQYFKGQVFEKPVKTTISLQINQLLTLSELESIQDKIRLAFQI